MAGFSAVVLVFKRRDSGKWLAADADRFQGMVIHAMAAAFFCLLPALIGVFVAEPPTIWRVGSALLGVQVVSHVILILSLASTTGASRALVLVGGLLVATLQVLNVAGLGFAQEFLPYLVGVVWHVLQAGFLFVMLIWIRPEDIEGV